MEKIYQSIENFTLYQILKTNFVPRVDVHLKNLILVRIAKKYGKTEISSFKFHRIAVYYTPLERAFRTEQNGVFEVRISSVFHAYFFKTKFWKTRLIFQFFFRIKRYGPDSNGDIDSTRGRLQDVL